MKTYKTAELGQENKEKEEWARLRAKETIRRGQAPRHGCMSSGSN